MTRILLDQGLPRTAARLLKTKGWDVLHTGDVGLSMATDRKILEYAREHGRSVITLDADFHSIIATENAASPSVVRIRREGLKGEEMAELIERIWPVIQEPMESGALVSVTETSIRIRNIPIGDTD